MFNNLYTIKDQDLIISSGYPASMWVVRDKEEDKARIKRIEHHLKVGDYFGTLGTILDLMDQITDKKLDELIEWKKEKRIYIKKLKNDLLYLQKNYKIVKKNGKQ